ncbi:helix-turn-helix domain-containing protein [Deinococcus sp. SL84]|nr:helix-turn-helix domain-containing protein [Deinococcus sp. SL84]
MYRIRSPLLRQLRQERKMSLAEVAAKAGPGVYRRFLRDLENGKDISVTINQLKQLGDVFGYSGAQCLQLVYDTELGYDHDVLAALLEPAPAASASHGVAG